MTIATDYVNHMYSLYNGRAAVTVGINSNSESIHPFVYENDGKVPIGLIAMSANDVALPTEVDLYHISAFLPDHGQGSEIMNFLCSAADQFGVRLNIDVNAQDSGRNTMTNLELGNWYRKFGFVGISTMHRLSSTCHIE